MSSEHQLDSLLNAKTQRSSAPVRAAFIWKQDKDIDHLENSVAQVTAKKYISLF